MSKAKLFIQLAKPDEEGYSDWVYPEQFKGIYQKLKHSNGNPWARHVEKKYKIVSERSNEQGTRVIRYRLAGKTVKTFNQYIRRDIREHYKNVPCPVTGEKKDLELDHKDGRKNDQRVSNSKTQRIEDFQNLSKTQNGFKREDCKKCKNTNKRFDAKERGYCVSFTCGNEDYTEELGCIGCYWHDVLHFKKSLTLANPNKTFLPIIK